MDEKKLTVLITGDNGECIPPPYGGIMKRCLLHSRLWREYGARVFIHVYHHHAEENDLDAGASYFYDYQRPPTAVDKITFVVRNFLRNPALFLRFFFLEWRLAPWFESSFLYYAARAVFLDRKLKTIRPDIVVAETGSFQTLAAVFLARRRHIPVAFENYAEIQYKAGDDGKNFASAYSKLWKYILDQVNLVVPASGHCAKGPRMYMSDESKIKIIYSGINFAVFNSRIDTNKKQTRKSFDLPQDKFIVMAVGSLKLRKGHDQLFESIFEIPEEDRKKVFITLCGMGDVEDLRQKAADLGFGPESLKIFHGLTEERLAELYSAADAFCFPSITPRECVGMAMKEAMAIGLPVAAYNAGGISEAIQEGINGFLVPVGDRRALGAAIVKLMNLEPEERKKIAQENVARARDLFDIQLTARALYEQLERLAEKRQQHG